MGSIRPAGQADRTPRPPLWAPLGAVVTVALCLLLAGCARSGDPADDPINTGDTPEAANRRAQRLVGTWRGQEQSANATFQFGAITFAPDGTYTAQMLYDDEPRAESGRWRVESDELVLEGGRRYEIEFRGSDRVVFRQPEMRVAVLLSRLR